jgi:hypothetical protein
MSGGADRGVDLEDNELAGGGKFTRGRRRPAEAVAARGGKNVGAPSPPASAHVNRTQRAPTGALSGDPRVQALEQRRLYCRVCVGVMLSALFLAMAAFVWFNGRIKRLVNRPPTPVALDPPGISRRANEREVEAIFAQCRHVPDTRTAPLKYLSEVLQVPGDRDEFGNASPFLQVCGHGDAR